MAKQEKCSRTRDMASDDDYLWIKTRDGSPTLWSNEISEPFRSTKGAFSESWAAFVQPALAAARTQGLTHIRVGEFGLGPGTNWVIWSIACRLMSLAFSYHVIEKEPEFFRTGTLKWASITPDVIAFVSHALTRDFRIQFSDDHLNAVTNELRDSQLEAPKIYASVDEAISVMGSKGVDIWFHDPFGFSVNPEGYSTETLAKCHKIWSPHVAGFSYASNRQFRDALAGINAGMVFKNCDTGNESLKRNRSEFYGPLYPQISALK